jgi:hypothetical protein
MVDVVLKVLCPIKEADALTRTTRFFQTKQARRTHSYEVE